MSEPQKSEPQNGRGALFAVGWPPFLRRPAALRAAGFDRLGVQRGMDRQPDGAGTLSPDLHRRSAGRACFSRRRIYRPAQPCKTG